MASPSGEIARLQHYVSRLAVAPRLSSMLIDRLTTESRSGRLPTSDSESSVTLLFQLFHRALLTYPNVTVDLRSKAIGRAVYVLTTIEKFSLREAAHILDLTPPEAQDLLETLRKNRPQKARVLILEDIEIVALDLKNIATRAGCQVVAVAYTEEEAVAKAQQSRPDLLLMDINLDGRGSGLKAAERILRSMDVPVIFITAYPERLLTAPRPEPTYLIAKPFVPETIISTIEQALLDHAIGTDPIFEISPDLTGLMGAAPVVDIAEGASRSPVPTAGGLTPTNIFEVRATAVLAISALEEAATFDEARHHNKPPPDLYVANEDYLIALRNIAGELRNVNSMLATSPESVAETRVAATKVNEYAKTFLHSYAEMLGKAAGYTTFGLIGLVLYRLGIGREILDEVWKIAKLPE
ncbi:MAG TPA: response regulator [Rhodanobacter sp.]|nr:response regulator [Rhodanobacter sp.]